MAAMIGDGRLEPQPEYPHVFMNHLPKMIAPEDGSIL